ncbi:MAG: glycoside hydrolase family 5 protein [Prolixibacteraceae bacterium]
MKRVIFPVIFALLFMMTKTVVAQVPFKRGVNLTNWFQTTSPGKIQFSKYTKKDFENIKSLGCDIIRLPINLFSMTGGKPDYLIDPIFSGYLDQAVSWAEELGLYLMIDNHSRDEIASKNPDLEIILTRVWEQLANRYKNRSALILFEIMNEPNGISTEVWGKIQQAAIDAIRKTDSKHTIVIGPSSFNTYNELSKLPVYKDPNLLYTFHFYDPFLFTHQGSTWANPALASLSEVPFPYSSETMPSRPAELAGTWVNSTYTNYPKEGNVARIRQLIDIATTFRSERKVNIFCGEFGVYMKSSKDAERVYWYSEVRKYLEEKGIPWTIWDYHGGFGLFVKGSEGQFEKDLNIPMVKVLGLKAPY